jgi:RNA polymerase sigma-70 factor, ECF subfamily
MLASTELVWLLAATAKGDQDAFELLYLATRGILYGIAMRILRQPALAEEVMQEAYVEIWRQAGGFSPRMGDPMTWMVAILRSAAFDFRLKRPETAHDQGGPSEVTFPAAEQLADPAMPEARRHVLTRLSHVDEEARRAVLLAYANGWSREQLASHLGQPVDVVVEALRDGIMGIRECLES